MPAAQTAMQRCVHAQLFSKETKRYAVRAYRAPKAAGAAAVLAAYGAGGVASALQWQFNRGTVEVASVCCPRCPCSFVRVAVGGHQGSSPKTIKRKQSHKEQRRAYETKKRTQQTQFRLEWNGSEILMEGLLKVGLRVCCPLLTCACTLTE